MEYPLEHVPAAPGAQTRMSQCLQAYDGFLKLSRRTPPETAGTLSSIDDPSRLADTIAEKHQGLGPRNFADFNVCRPEG